MTTVSTSLQSRLLEFIGEMRHIQSLYQSIPRTEPERIGREIDDFLTRINIKETKSLLGGIPMRFHRQYILASIRGALKKLKKAGKLACRESLELSAKEIEYALLWMQQALKITDIIAFFQQIMSQDKSNLFLSPSHLLKSDIVLSYKTTYYLKKSITSQLVATATNSAITHAMLVCHEENNVPKLLVSGDSTSGLGLVDPTAAPGEMLIVMRPTNISDRPNLSAAIDVWRARAFHRQETPLQNEKARWKFAEVKSQVASAIGFCYVFSIKLLARPLVFANPIRSDSKLFCSELIDIIFKKAGILLSPRSEHEAIIGPIEILYSPALSLVGVIARQEDWANVESEIRSQFFTNTESLCRPFLNLFLGKCRYLFSIFMKGASIWFRMLISYRAQTLDTARR